MWEALGNQVLVYILALLARHKLLSNLSLPMYNVTAGDMTTPVSFERKVGALPFEVK
jgi:hypothetical protein